MTRSSAAAIAWFACTALWISAPVLAQDAEPSADASLESPVVAPEKPAPYDPKLIRLAEILGSVHYLRTLCNGQAEDGWRKAMQDLIDREAANEVQRRARFTAAFNRGYRTFASVYTRCTEPAVVAEARYRAEGATLAAEIIARFGN